jgi:hypothetical protein
MNTSGRFIVGCVFALSSLATVKADDAAKAPSFLKTGKQYRIFVALPDRTPYVGKIAEIGPGRWIRFENLVATETKKRSGPDPGEAPGAVIGECMINLTMVSAVIPEEKSAEDNPASGVVADSPGFPKVGTTYFIGGTGGLPNFAKVLEVTEDGWFRAVELKPKWLKDTRANLGRQWWINSAFVAGLSEAKPKDLPD